MSSTTEDKDRHEWRRQKNLMAKALQSKIFSEKVKLSKKGREKRITVKNIEDFIENDD